MAKKSGGYLGLGYVVSIILAIIPITNIVLGIVFRVQKGKILLAVLNFFLAPLFWIVDLISIILNGGLKYLV